MTLKTFSQMEDEADETGASTLRLWGSFMLKLTDEGEWFFEDDREHLITRNEALELRDCFRDA